MSAAGTWDLLLDAFRLDNHGLLLSAAVTNLWGYLGYGIALYNVVTRKKDILPFWMHAFYLAHDSSLSVRALMAAPSHDWHWFLVSTGVAMGLWTVQEIYVISNAIFHEGHRRDVWGAGTTVPAALGSAARQIAVWYAAFNLAFEFLDGNPRGSPMFSWNIFTNVVFSTGVSELWRTRRTREDCGGLLFVCALLGSAVNSFYPGNMWRMVAPGLYDSLWYRATGVVTVAINLANVAWVYSLPNEVPNKRKANGEVKAKVNGKAH